ncbi:MAG: hypothetical protein R6V07_00130 [Armatimonadota bacterium]
MDNEKLSELAGDVSWLAPRSTCEATGEEGVLEAIEACVRDYATSLNEARAKAESRREETDACLAALADLIHSLDVTLAETEQDLSAMGLGQVHRRVRLVTDQMRDLLAVSDVIFEDLTGLPFEDDVIERSDVDGWRRSEDFETEIVAETVKPAIEVRGKLYRRARIVAGGPPL